MTATSERLTGGCQCGAVRFACEGLGRASICHCRMCQKAFGGFFGPLVGAIGLAWTRGAPAYFRSSNKVRRGFCAACGTPLTFEVDGAATTEVAIGAFDTPDRIRPVLQLGTSGALPYVAALAGLPVPTDAERQTFASYYDSIISYQHPDHDTDDVAFAAKRANP